MLNIDDTAAVFRPGVRFWLTHLFLPVLAALLALWLLEPGGLDLWLADQWYAAQGYSWLWADHWLAYDVIHHYGKLLIILIWLSLGVTLFLTYRKPRLRPYRGTLAFVMTGMALLPSIIGRTKRYTAVPCPWDLARYGGDAPYRFNLDYVFPATDLGGHCFPAGHASGGFAMLIMYFAAIPWMRKPGWMLLPGLLVGFTFGTGQQARGAHLFSHDVWTMTLCWVGSLGLFMLFRARGWLPATAPASPNGRSPLGMPAAAGFAGFSINRLLVLAALFITLFANQAFFRNLQATLAGSSAGYFHMFSLAVVLWCLLVVVLSLFSWRPVFKPAMTLMFLVAAVCAYFMDSYNIIIDQDMLLNVAATDTAETADLLSIKLFLYVLLLGVLPSVLLWMAPLKPQKPLRALAARSALTGSAVLLVVAMLFISSAFYTSFFREQKIVRYYANPLTAVYSAYRYGRNQLDAGQAGDLQIIGEDAQVAATVGHHELTIMVVGETARADRFSVNGYRRPTNPRMDEANVISFTQVSSCGTSTAQSVPCMFAESGREQFDLKRAEHTYNVLDVLDTAGVNVLWLDNNSTSKGVADRVTQRDYRDPGVNTECDLECRDEGMLSSLQRYIDEHADGDTLVVLHQMGSHGPAYYKRYPPAFELFTPACQSSQLSDCTLEEINNSYDNTIAYTDHFLGKVIDLLAQNDHQFDTAMMYVGDHGESLGENGLYLHGLPYWIAPEEQTRVPMIFWFGPNNHDVDVAALRRLKDRAYSHDNVFHTLLSLFEVSSTVYNPELDLLHRSQQLAMSEDEA